MSRFGTGVDNPRIGSSDPICLICKKPIQDGDEMIGAKQKGGPAHTFCARHIGGCMDKEDVCEDCLDYRLVVSSRRGEVSGLNIAAKWLLDMAGWENDAQARGYRAMANMLQMKADKAQADLDTYMKKKSEGVPT